MTEERKPPWKELAWICGVIHRQLYLRSDAAEALLYAPRLAEMIADLPQEIEALCHAEALALHHELRQEWEDALRSRRQELRLMRVLYADIRENQYPAATIEFLLQSRGEEVYQMRLAMLERLKERVRPA